MSSMSSQPRLFRVCWCGSFGLIKNALHWRRGALFRYGSAMAKVWATQDERWVYATISGSREVRDDLTTILRETLQSLFAEYKDLKRRRKHEAERSEERATRADVCELLS